MIELSSNKMRKKYVILMGLVGAVLVLGGCQGPVDINDDIQNEIEKNKQAREEVVKSQDLSEISGDAKVITNKISENSDSSVDVLGKKAIGDSSEKEDLDSDKEDKNSNKKNSMNNDEKTEVSNEDGLPIDMELAKTCKSAVLKTSMGDIEIEFFGDKAPTAVANFCTLSKKGFYDGVVFHRIIKDFMIQGGDPEGTGMGGPGYKFKDEIYAGNSNNEYTISLANAGPNTNGSQFFINTKANNFLDTKHTVFGKVVSGQDIVDKMEQVETGAGDRPVTEVKIIKSVISE